MNTKSYISSIKIFEDRNYFYPIVLSVVTILIYYPILGNQILNGWDDSWQVVNNYTSNGFALKNLKEIFTNTLNGQYSPVNQLVYTLVYKVDGYSPIFFHLLSLLLHLANVILVFFTIKTIVFQITLINSANKKDLMLYCFYCAAIFSVHPLQVEAVAWISASKVLLFTFFYLLGTLAFIRFLQTQNYWFYIFTFFFFILSYGSKEQAVTFPVFLILLGGVFGLLKNKFVWLSLLPLFVLCFCFVFYFKSISHSYLTESNLFPFWQRPLIALHSISFISVKWLVPHNLSYLYPIPFRPDEVLPSPIIFYPVAYFLLLFTFSKLIFQHRVLLFGILFFIIHILLMSHIVPTPRITLSADRYMYLSSIGFITILSFALLKLNKISNLFRLVCFLLLMLGMGYLSHNRCKVWYNTQTLCSVISRKDLMDTNANKLHQDQTAKDKLS